MILLKCKRSGRPWVKYHSTKFQLTLPVDSHGVGSDGSEDARRGSPDIPNELSD